jgi:hypothetical protein
VIRVFYDGYGTNFIEHKREVIKENGVDIITPRKITEIRTNLNVNHDGTVDVCWRGEYCLPHGAESRFNNFGFATVDYLIPVNVNPKSAGENLSITDKDGNKAPFEIVKGQDIYRHENGNALRIFFDDAPPDDIAPNEKPLSDRERNTTLNIIYGLLELLKESGKSQNEIISELERFDYRGLKKSTLETYFSNANKIHERG